jgi:hypothetical protein
MDVGEGGHKWCVLSSVIGDLIASQVYSGEDRGMNCFWSWWREEWWSAVVTGGAALCLSTGWRHK